jgi:hypothetical protein
VIESKAIRLAQVARDTRLTDAEREAAKESLRQIAAGDISAIERARAEATLAELGIAEAAPSETASQSGLGEAGRKTEAYLRTVPLDALASRFLAFAGHTTFHSVLPQDIDGFARQEKPSREETEGLQALSAGAWQVHASYVDPETEANLYQIISILGGAGVSLDDAKARYQAIAAGRE